jgi:hypothetical protein
MKTYLLLLSLFCLPLFLPAQEVLLFDDTPSKTVVYRYSQLNGPSAPALQQIFRLLQPHQPQQAALDVYYRYQLRILEGTNLLKNCIQWEAVEADRAPRPFGFTFEGLLVPSGATYNMELLADGEVVATKCIEQAFGQTLPGYTFDFSEIEGGVFYTLRISDLTFKYGSRHVQAVQQRMRAIDQYFIAKDKLTALHRSLTAFRQLEPRPQQLDSYRQQLRGYEEQLSKICGAPFWNTLALDTPDAHDPEQLKATQLACQEEVYAWKSWLNELTANLHILYFEQGVAAYQNGQLHHAREAFHASLRTNDCYAPSHYFLAALDFEQGKVEDAAQRIRLVLNRYNPDPNIREDASHLASGIVRFYLDAGQDAVALRRYPEGVAAYQQALAFSESIKGFHFGQAEARSRIQEAYYLDFHDQVDQVVYTQKTGQYQRALEQLSEALEFQERFRVNSTVDTESLARGIVNDLHQEQLAEIRSYRYQGEWDQALSAVASAEKLLQAYPGMVDQPQQLAQEKQQVLLGKHQKMVASTEALIQQQRFDQALTEAEASLQFVQTYQLGNSQERESQRLITRVQQYRYDRFVRGGKRAQQEGNYTSALDQYQRAQALEQQVATLSPSIGLAQQIKTTALLEAERVYKSVLRQSADDNEQLAQAKAQIQALANRFNIMRETQLVSIIGQLNEQQCTNARDLLLPREEDQLASELQASDYLAAQATLSRIDALHKAYPDCALSDASLQMNQRIVAVCAAYQAAIQAAETAEHQQQFSRAIEYYVTAKNNYADASVQARLAPHPALNLYAYISDHDNYRMSLAGAHFYLDQREHDRSLELLNLMIDRGIEQRQTEGLQLRLGSALAVRHYVASANWKETFYSFVAKEDRKVYKPLYRSFRKQWRRMA